MEYLIISAILVVLFNCMWFLIGNPKEYLELYNFKKTGWLSIGIILFNLSIPVLFVINSIIY